MRADATTSSPDPQARAAGFSRRRLLAFGLALLPGALGTRFLSQLVAPSSGVAAAADPVPPPNEAYDPAAHRWGFVVDTTTCIGCGRCVEACKLENHVPEEAALNRTWIEMHALQADGTVHVESPDAGRNGFVGMSLLPAEVAIVDAYFVPRLCMQCENPPCTWVCPVSATFRMADGVVLVDERRCIGCGYCITACPYGARYMVPAGETLPKGQSGVVDKCTFCYHRVTRGLDPACVEVCPVGARVFGDLNDVASPAAMAIAAKRTRVMKASLGTRPRVSYVGLEREVD
jgi:tetrathionate reductase subunit B